MHPRIVLVAVIAALCSGSAVASAESFTFSAHGGWSTPLGALDDEVADGFHVGASASYPIDGRHHALLELNRHVLGYGPRIPLPFALSVREQLQITETVIGFRAQIAPRAPITPYFKFGAALEFLEPTLVFDAGYQSIRIVDPHFRPGLTSGLGLSMRLGASNGVRLEGAVHAIASDPKTLTFGTAALTLWSSFGH